VDLLGRLAVGEDEPVEALFGPRQAFFRTSRATLTARYVAGDYPDWRKAVPERPPLALALPVGPLLSAVRQAAVVREQPVARLVLRFEPGRLTLEAKAAGAGASRVEQELAFAGEPLAIALNPRHLIEVLRSLDPEEAVELGLTDPDSPVLLTAGDHYRHVLMPLPR
jgi:DNA polymerase-3 subunit beta